MSSNDSQFRVLCVDDEPGLAGLIGVFVEREDDRLSVTAATSAEEGLERLAELRIDCIVSDYDMAGMDGLAFLEAVRAASPDLPFVLFTGRGSEEVASRAISAGATDYVQKGTGTDRYPLLARRIRNAIESYHARRKAAEAYERARTILDVSPDAVLVGIGGEVRYANAAAADLFGVEDDATLLGSPFGELIASEADGVPPELLAVGGDVGSMDESRTIRSRHTLRRRGDEAFPAEVIVRRVTWEGGPGVVAIVRDLSDRERQAREGGRYRASFDRSIDGIVIADDDGRFLDVNRSACDLFGLPREELLGRRITEFAPAEFDFDAAWGAFRTTRSERGTFTIVRPDGERRLVEYAATTDVVPGQHLSVLRDVTERTRLEDRLRREQQVLREMYRITADRDAAFEAKLRRLLRVGSEFLDVPYGFLTRIRAGTQHVVEAHGDHDLLRPGETCPLSEAYCRRTVARDELVTVRNAPSEGWADDPAYERFRLGCYVGAKVIVEDELYGTVCFAGTGPREEAFSEIERTFVELLARWISYELEGHRTTRELRRKNEQLEEFASIVSHDLRNPLSVASGYLELAREGGTPEQFDRIENALDRMDRLIGDLLYLARRGEEIGATEPVDLREAAAAAWAVVDDGEGSATLRIDDGVEPILADEDRLRQLLENLFRNAVEHGGPGVTVGVVPLESGFAVEDDGPGVPADLRESVFRRGYSTREGNSGFGLYIVRQIADAHGWTATVGASDAGGARFEFTDVGSR
jgi:PAS domain S-box-containing protein